MTNDNKRRSLLFSSVLLLYSTTANADFIFNGENLGFSPTEDVSLTSATSTYQSSNSSDVLDVDLAAYSYSVDLAGGDDLITLNNFMFQDFVETGTGDDIITAGYQGQSVGSFGSYVDLGSGDDQFIVNDLGVIFSSITENILLDAGSGVDTLTLQTSENFTLGANNSRAAAYTLAANFENLELKNDVTYTISGSSNTTVGDYVFSGDVILHDAAGMTVDDNITVKANRIIKDSSAVAEANIITIDAGAKLEDLDGGNFIDFSNSTSNDVININGELIGNIHFGSGDNNLNIVKLGNQYTIAGDLTAGGGNDTINSDSDITFSGTMNLGEGINEVVFSGTNNIFTNNGEVNSDLTVRNGDFVHASNAVFRSVIDGATKTASNQLTVEDGDLTLEAGSSINIDYINPNDFSFADKIQIMSVTNGDIIDEGVTFIASFLGNNLFADYQKEEDTIYAAIKSDDFSSCSSASVKGACDFIMSLLSKDLDSLSADEIEFLNNFVTLSEADRNIMLVNITSGSVFANVSENNNDAMVAHYNAIHSRLSERGNLTTINSNAFSGSEVYNLFNYQPSNISAKKSFRSISSDDYLPDSTINSVGCGVWGKLYISQKTLENDGNLKGYDSEMNGQVIGSDCRFSDVLVGVAMGFSKSDIEHNLGFAADIETIYGSIYGAYQKNDYFVNASLSYGKAENDVSRAIQVLTLSKTAKSKYDSKIMGANLKLGKNFKKEKMIFTPNIGLSYNNTRSDAFVETGATILNQKVDEYSSDSLMAEIGFNVSHKSNYLFNYKKPFHSNLLNVIKTASIKYTSELKDNDDVNSELLDREITSIAAEEAKQNIVVGLRLTAEISHISNPKKVRHYVSGGLDFAEGLDKKSNEQTLSASYKFMF